MLKLLLRAILVTIVLEGASLMFADEFVVTTLILVTIAATTAAMFLGRNESEPTLTGSPSSEA